MSRCGRIGELGGRSMGACLRRHETPNATPLLPTPGPLFEALDPRTLLSANFAGVGLAAADSDTYAAWSYVIEGSVNDQGQTSASFVDSGGPNPPVALGPISGISLARLGGGRMTINDKGWMDPTRPAEDASASSFFAASGNAIGWTYAEYVQDWAVDEEFFLFVERPTSATITDLDGSWNFLWIGTTTSGDDFEAFIAEGNTAVSGSTMSFNSLAGDDDLGAFSVTISGVTTDGRVSLAEDPESVMYLNAAKNFIVFATGGLETTDPGVGLMYRTATPTSLNVVGSYRWTLDDNDDSGQNFDDSGGGGNEDGILNIKDNGTFTLVGSSSYDDGYSDDDSGKIERSGTWAIQSGRLVLITSDDDSNVSTASFILGADGNTLISSSSDDSEAYLSIATRIIPTSVTSDTGTAVATYASLDDSGRPRIFELGDDKYWRDVDLSAYGPDSVSDLVSWCDEDDGSTYAVGAGVDTTYYHRNDDGSWSGTSLTQLVNGSTAIVSQIEVMEDNTGNVHILGLNAQGHIVRYTLPAGSSEWEYHNVTLEDLSANSEDVPVFVGNLISYDTSWEGLNLAGIDSNGDIWSVWWAPGLGYWQSDNLSQVTGASSINFVGGLTVYLTSWGGINIGGVDDSGDIQVVWWVPSFGGDWEISNLTDQFSGPSLTPTSVSSYRSSWDGLNIVGFDQSTGEVKVYWWAPGMTDWSITSLSSTVGMTATDPSTALRGIAGADDSLNVVGRSDDGEIVRYYWEPEFGGEWLVENPGDCAYDGG